MLIYLLVFFTALIVTYFLIPVVRNLAYKWGAVDHPGGRRMHTGSIPRLGGLAIFVGFLSALFVGLILRGGVKYLNIHLLIGMVLGGAIILVLGMVDDIKRVRPITKLLFQTLAALVVIYFGVGITFISTPFNWTLPLYFWGIPLTVLWLVGLTNAINLIDGLDGLAGGVVTISALTLFLVAAVAVHQIEAAFLLIALAGATLGFLRYNFFPASIFLGDSGSLFLGFMLAGTSIMGVLKSTLVIALILPVLILAVPIFDTLLAIVRRAKAGKHIFSADRGHIHHLLVDSGFTQRETVLLIYLACMFLSMLAIVITFVRKG
ncbi:MAG: MraY family glycosyltransferase [Candidatus Saganbacteria bacterium]|nr:MraY family glycosyltransferase [Candidatus Saganbacteria bacterium]